MKNNSLLLRLTFLLLLSLFVGTATVSAYIRVLSAPVFSADTSDNHLYFQGVNNLFFKVASDSAEIVVASENTLNPTPTIPPSNFPFLATQLGAGGQTPVTIFSPPSVPGDGWCYFQGSINYNYSNVTTGMLYSLAKVEVDGNNFSTFDNLVTTAFAPAASTDGYIYYFSYINPLTKRPNMQGLPQLFKIPATASSITEVQPIIQVGTGNQKASIFGLSTPCVPGNGNIYFQGNGNPGPGSGLYGVSTQGGPVTNFNVLTLSTPFVGPNFQANSLVLYFQNGNTDLHYQQLSSVYLNGSGLTPNLGPTIATTPYVGPDRCVYFLDTGNNMYQLNLVSGVLTNLYISANSAPVSYDNGDGTITLFFQGTDNKLKKFTPPVSGNL
ncbi:MAG: hypothetical protein K2W99_04630 [Chthoniobacterales bacterium]|nr:hypothetical protein [Chthoniobacterales bacterium]